MVWIRENLLGSARKPIAEIAVGDEVASWNPLTDSANYARVTGKSSRLAPYALRLTLADAAGKTETVTVTPGHPYLIAANDNAPGPHLVVMQPAGHWTAARYLKAGEKIASATGTPVSVVSTEVDSNPLRVYDLEVENLHSFAVGEQGPWVHNSVNQMNQETNRGQSPPGIIRTDRGLVTAEQDHVHFDCGAALNKDGTWKHGSRELKKKRRPG